MDDDKEADYIKEEADTSFLPEVDLADSLVGVNDVTDTTGAEGEGLPCKVCGDRSSGVHYGVTSCEGCKGFFRRSIQKQIDYRCLRGAQCVVSRANRNRCQYCRFKRCLAVGMSKDSVRYGRIPKRMKESPSAGAVEETQIRAADTSGATGQAGADPDRELAIYDVILTVSQAHHTHCMTTEDKIQVIRRMSTTLCQGTTVGYDQQKLGMWQNLAKLITPVVQRVVEFSKRVPGFGDLTQDDQLILIKSAFFELWLIRLARLCEGEDDVLTMSDGAQIPRVELELLYSEEFVEAMFQFAQSFNQLKLSDTEIGLFSAVVLTTSDRVSLSEPQKVKRIQDTLIEALSLQITRNHPKKLGLFGYVLMKIPDLRTIGANHNRELDYYRQHWGALRLPPLFAEIYDIQKTAETEAYVDSDSDS